MTIREMAWDFSLKNEINAFRLDFEKTCKIVKDNGWELCSFSEKPELVKEFQIESEAENDCGLTYCLRIGAETRYFIFYNNRLSYKERIYTIFHEIAHIALSHTSSGGVVGRSSDTRQTAEQEDEADQFACEILLPSCVFKTMRIRAYNQIEEISQIPQKEAVHYFGEASKTELAVNDQLKTEMLNQYNKTIKEFRKSKTNKFKKPILIISVLAICAAIWFSYFFSLNNYTVYITPTGHKYHTEDCSYIYINTATALSKHEAEKQGYAPCSKCDPDKK